MSGDVQPRKRKDKKRKKDEPSLEEHRGTSAAFGEGDVQMHSQHDHGTGGHWCAKIIFFSLLAVLVTLVGLIILENRGLSELEAKAVESQYSGILDGWIEDTPEDDHHDEHTLELKHHEHDDDEHGTDDDLEFGDQDVDNGEDDEHEEGIDHDEVDDEDDEENLDGDEDGRDDENYEDDEENESNEIDEDNEIQDDENDDDEENESYEIGEDNQIQDDEDDEDDEENESKERDEDDEIQGDETDQDHENDDENKDDEDEVDEEQNVRATEASYENTPDDDDDDSVGDDYNGDDKNLDDSTEEWEDDDNEDLEDDDNDISNEIANNDGNDIPVNAQSEENDDKDEGNIEEGQDDEDDEEHEEDHEEEVEEEIEKIEKEVLDQEEPESVEVLPNVSVEKEEETSVEAVSPDEEYEVDEKEFLELDDLDEPAVERIAAPPPGKPYVEIEEEVSVEIHTDTLAAEEEYEKQQEELRQQEAQSSHMWLKLAVGGALLAATHAVIRRATAPRDVPESEQDEHASREETPLTDRRMTLIPGETSKVIPPQSLQPKVEEEIVPKLTSVTKAAPVQKQDSEELDDDVAVDEEVEEDQEPHVNKNDDENKELYSDDEENEDEEVVEEEEEIEEKKEAPKSILKVPAPKEEAKPKPEEVPDDVEIIDDDIDEEVEEEVEDEEEISDVDDAELLSRLEAKYGRLPEPERPGPKHKDGGNSLEDDWPGEPSDPFWREQLEKAEQDLRQGSWGACEERARAAPLAGSARARWLQARALDALADEQRDNRLLSRAIAAYLHLLKMNEQLSDKKLLEVATRTLNRIQFRGSYINAEPVYKLLIRRFPNDVTHRNNLTISYLMANRADLAINVLKETLKLWPNDRVALAHYGFVLKTEKNELEEAVKYFQRALEGDAGSANEPRFYYHLGDALLMLGRKEEADEVHRRGAALGHFLSPSQRSLYNVPRLKSQPWWDVHATPYAKLARDLENNWREILKEGEEARALYEQEKEGLRERGEWSQLDVLVRGREVGGRCARAPTTCRLVRAEPAALCRRGQVKFSLLAGGTHVRAHVGPTNCRLRLHLALANTERAHLRVGDETRQWQVGKVLMFDDSFEHEVWHNGTQPRLVLIVDVWHPDLTPQERRTLPPI